MHAPPAQQDDWDSHWNQYAVSASQNPAQRMRHEIVARLLKEFGTTRERRILDFGSGQGDLITRLSVLMPQADFLGVELSSSGVAISRMKAPGAKFLAANLFNPSQELLGFRNWATDAVCSEVLEHLDDPGAFLRCMDGYLQTGARLFVTVPGGPMSAFDSLIGHRRHFTRSSIQALLELSGYRVDRICAAGFPFFNIYRLLVIARGARLADDVSAHGRRTTSRLAGLAMKVFQILFKFNFLDFPFGWQIIAVASKSRP